MDKFVGGRVSGNRKSAVMIRYFIVFLLFFNLTTAFGQNLSQHNWYFGSTSDGIRFNRGTNLPTQVTNQAIPFNTGGSAVATDPATGNLLFYTDGTRIYDGCHLPMPNGTGLLANTTANQPVAICPVPGQTNKYFVFANSANFGVGGTITRSVVDLSQLGNATSQPGLGVVEAANKNAAVPGLTNRSEGMIIIPHPNGTDYWLITHQNNSADFLATKITAASYTAGTFNSVISINIGNPSPLPISVSNFSYNHKLKKLAVAVQSVKDDAMILNFDPGIPTLPVSGTEGFMILDRYILNTGVLTATTQSMYDIQWDIKGGQYVYISRIGEAGIPADVIQYDYKNSTPASTINISVLPASVSAVIAKSYGLQLAPDSAIYHLYQDNTGKFLVEKFSKTDTLAAFVKVAQLGATDFKGTQFPSFLPTSNANLTIDFTFSTPTCQNNPITFFPDVKPNADSLVWDFGDGSKTVKAWSPVYTYKNQGTFNTMVTAYYQGQKKISLPKPVTVNKFDLKIQLVQDTTACKSEFPPPRGTSSPKQFSVTVKVTQGTATSYNWSNGNTGATLKPDSAGYYYVVVTDATGCSTYAGVNVKEYKLNDQRSNIWYFGTKAGIDFNKKPPVALNTSAMDAPAGCAIVCDRNGKVIFYTDGSNVYDKTNTLIDTGIGGDPTSTQSSLIVPVPGDETLYYILTTQAISGTSLFELRYSIFDLKQNAGKGLVTKKNILLFSKSTERVTANGKWIVAHEYGNSIFRTFQISKNGIGSAVYTEIGSPHSFKTKENGQGYMKLGIRNNLAVPISTPGSSNLLELFQLNDTTGVIYSYRKTNLNEANGQIYGVEFSPGGRKVFATVRGVPAAGQSEIFEYYLDSLDKKPPVFLQKVAKPIDMGALQIAPDNQIYIAFNDATNNKALGTVLSNENKIPTNSSFNFNGFALASGTKSTLGLPNFIQQQGNGFGGPGFTFTGICKGDTTKFNGTPTDAIDKFQWAFGDGAGSTISNPTHLYAAAGTYTVSMRLTNRCGLDTTIVQQVKINPPAPKPTNKPVDVLCNGPVTLNAGPATTWLWTDGSTTQTVVIKNPAVISVTTTDANGCKAKAKSIVVDNRPIVDLGPDIEVCQNSVVPNLNANNAGATFVWTLNGAANGNTSGVQAIDTTLPAILKYSVTVKDPITTCQTTFTKIVTIKVSPAFTLTKTDPTTCNTPTGTVTLTNTPTVPAGGPYSYFLTGPTLNQVGFDQVQGFTVGPIGGVSAGTVSAIVTDQISGCTISNSVSLTDAIFTSGVTFTNCNPSVVTVSTLTGAPVAPLKYTFTNVATGSVLGPQISNTASLAPGDYSIQVRDNNGAGCTYTFNRTINPVVPTLTVTPDLCAGNITASVAGGVTYNWTRPDGTTPTGATISLTTSGAYIVKADIGGGCTLTQSTNVTYTPIPTPDFTQTNGCATQITLTATPSGSYTYRWYKGGAFQAGLLGRIITLGQSEDGASYAVELVDGVSGCTKQSTPKLVQVSGIVDAAVTATQACQDTNPFTITATTTATGVAYAWAFNNTTIAGQTNPTLKDTKEGIYKVTISKSTCNASASIQIIKAPIPQGQLKGAVVICNDPDNLDPATSQVDLDPGAFSTYDWFKNQVTLNYKKRIFTATSEGIYEVTLVNSFGCTNTDKTEVLNECIPKIVGPNAFRPASGEVVNKNFFVYSFFITDNFEIAIFNRWGELVFESKKRDFRWNGGYNNNASQPLPGGTYSYVVRYESSFRPQEGIKEQRGGVVLLR